MQRIGCRLSIITLCIGIILEWKIRAVDFFFFSIPLEEQQQYLYLGLFKHRFLHQQLTTVYPNDVHS